MSRLSSALRAVTAEAWPRVRSIKASRADISRTRRAEDRDLPTWPRKEDAACCVSRRDDLGRLPVGFCSAGCERRIPPSDRSAASPKVAS